MKTGHSVWLEAASIFLLLLFTNKKEACKDDQVSVHCFVNLFNVWKLHYNFHHGIVTLFDISMGEAKLSFEKIKDLCSYVST